MVVMVEEVRQRMDPVEGTELVVGMLVVVVGVDENYQ